MKKRVLDSNIIIDLFRGDLKIKGKVLPKVTSVRTARSSVKQWLRENPSDVIVTPVRLEFLSGIRNKNELELADAFLEEFPLLDGGKVLTRDWEEAARLARRRPSKARTREDVRARDAVDCLIRAICKRLHVDYKTDDTGWND